MLHAFASHIALVSWQCAIDMIDIQSVSWHMSSTLWSRPTRSKIFGVSNTCPTDRIFWRTGSIRPMTDFKINISLSSKFEGSSISWKYYDFVYNIYIYIAYLHKYMRNSSLTSSGKQIEDWIFYLRVAHPGLKDVLHSEILKHILSASPSVYLFDMYSWCSQRGGQDGRKNLSGNSPIGRRYRIQLVRRSIELGSIMRVFFGQFWELAWIRKHGNRNLL